MSLHVYFCRLPYTVNVGRSWDPPDPGEDYTPCEMIVAESRGRAKALFMASDPGVDEFTEIRANCVARYVDDLLERSDGTYISPAREGVLQAPRDLDPPEPGQGWDPKIPGYQRLYFDCWARVHEIEQHGGGECDCPELEWDEKTQDWKEVAA